MFHVSVTHNNLLTYLLYFLFTSFSMCVSSGFPSVYFLFDLDDNPTHCHGKLDQNFLLNVKRITSSVPSHKVRFPYRTCFFAHTFFRVRHKFWYPRTVSSSCRKSPSFPPSTPIFLTKFVQYFLDLPYGSPNF